MSTKFINENISREQKVLNAARKLLIGKKLCGNFSDRRYIEDLKGYRDAVYVDRSELVIIEDLNNVRQALMECKNVNWPSIKEEEKQTVIFTTVSSGVPLGMHMWEITHVDINQSEFTLMLKNTRLPEKRSTSQLDIADIIRTTISSLRLLLTIENIQGTLKYLFILLITLLDVFVQLCKLFVILIHVILTHFPRVVDSLTPFCISIVNGLTKCVGGFYILLAMVWRRVMPPQTPQQRSEFVPQLSDNSWTDVSSPYHYRQDTAYRNKLAREQYFKQLH